MDVDGELEFVISTRNHNFRQHGHWVSLIDVRINGHRWHLVRLLMFLNWFRLCLWSVGVYYIVKFVSIVLDTLAVEIVNWLWGLMSGIDVMTIYV